MDLPCIDVSGLGTARGHREVGAAIDRAAREVGFFRVTGHGVDPRLRDDLEAAARAFFALDDAAKDAVAMRHGGRAWRGWFPLGGELTSGRPDGKEGLYFGREPAPGVHDDRPLHGPNLFPTDPAALRPAVLAWMAAMEALGQQLLAAMAVGLGLDAGWFARELTADPVVLFRIFRYPPWAGGPWGVGEHTDYGLLTLLAQDDQGGLEVRTPGGWTEVPADRDVIVCNIGDMLERMTAGRYRSTPHRVRASADRDRLSFPFFLDPGWDAAVRPVPTDAPPADRPGERWDGGDVHAWSGAYGDYLCEKVARVFPALADQALGSRPKASRTAVRKDRSV